MDRPKQLQLLLCPPLYLSNEIKNNVWMKKYNEKIDRDKAMSQFFNMYSLFSNDALVYLLPPKRGLQDQVYITNAACILPHKNKVAIITRFKAEGRKGEEEECREFLEKLEYKCVYSPYFFEGEAELKWVRDNLYIGGYGERTSIDALEWISKEFDAEIIPVKTTPERYHLDCSVFPINSEKIICSEKIDNLKLLEKKVECITVPDKYCNIGITNSIRIGTIIYNASHISELKANSQEYLDEKSKNEMLEKICRDIGLELIFINLSEFLKSGALLSCCILHLTYNDFKTDM